MGEDYWNSSSVSKKNMFDIDGNNTLDDIILDSSRSTPPINTTGVVSARFRPATATPTTTTTTTAAAKATITKPAANNSLITTTTTTSNQPKFTIPTSQVSRPIDQSVESARFGRSPVPGPSNDIHSNAQWLPNAEEYPDQNVRDRSTQYDKEMELRCKNLLENKNAKLDDIQDYDKKASLLRMAIKVNTPNATVPVLIFLENTLSRPLFFDLIKQHPQAINNYINMTKLRFDNDYYVSMLKQFGRNEDVAMIRLRQASQVNDMNTKMAILDQAATELGSHPWWHLQIAEQRILLKKQRELQNSQASRTVLEIYKTVYETDFRKQKQNRNTDKTALDRSKEFETAFHMSPEIIMCGKLSVIMQCGLRSHYDDFIHQAIHQGIFGKKYIIAPEYLADMVYNWVRVSGDGAEKASETAARFLTMIPDPDKRIYFAEKFQNFDVAIDTIVNILRDRLQLENLRRRMPHDHPAFNKATSLLENTKWRN
ncbi:unnamed protein product [Rotaria socialis]|uniref:Vps16 C-terminal domain-containing protein n=1 Tax=Rotaria socialis TaxID=392032 RepID=A0A817Y551_9BILA|nr:unnamed protein product [Rotaria socialis]